MQNFRIFAPKTPHFSKKTRFVNPTFGSLCSTYPLKKLSASPTQPNGNICSKTKFTNQNIKNKNHFTIEENQCALTFSKGMATLPRKSGIPYLFSSNTVISNTEWISFTLLKQTMQEKGNYVPITNNQIAKEKISTLNSYLESSE